MSYSFLDNLELVGASVLDLMNPFSQLHYIQTGEANTPLTANVVADQLYSHGDISRDLTPEERERLALNGADKLAIAAKKTASEIADGAGEGLDVLAWVALHWKPLAIGAGVLVAGAYLWPLIVPALTAKAAK